MSPGLAGVGVAGGTTSVAAITPGTGGKGSLSQTLRCIPNVTLHRALPPLPPNPPSTPLPCCMARQSLVLLQTLVLTPWTEGVSQNSSPADTWGRLSTQNQVP